MVAEKDLQLFEFVAHFELTCIVVSIIANVIVIYLILYRSPKEIGAYQYLLFAFVINAIYYSFIHVLTLPVICSYKDALIMFSYGILTSKVSICLYACTFSQTMPLLAHLFIYRLIAAKWPHNIRIYTRFSCFVIVSVTVVVESALWFFNCYVNYGLDQETLEYAQPFLDEEFSGEEIEFIGALYYVGCPIISKIIPVFHFDAESVDILTNLVQSLHVKLDKLLISNSQPYVNPVVPQPNSNVSYASIVRALADSEKIKGKSQRAVLVGSSEKATPQETAKHDEQTLKDIIDRTNDQELKEAYGKGHITHHRFPESKPAGRRIIKYSLPSTALRDKLLAGIRSIGRPTSFEPSMYLRRDLMPTELEQEREARNEARKRNLIAGCLRWGVRDCEIIEFKGPNYRDLPPNYRSKSNESHDKQSNVPIESKVPALSTILPPGSTKSQNIKSNQSNSSAVATESNSSTPTPNANVDNVTVRKKEEKSPTAPSAPSSGGTSAKDDRAPKLH